MPTIPTDGSDNVTVKSEPTWEAPRLIWIDVETSGLEPKEHKLLEIYVGITNSRLEIERSKHFVVRDLDPLASASDYVSQLHLKSGLAQECVGSVYDNSEVETQLIDFMLTLPNQDMIELLPLAGSRPSFDRDWIQYHLPRFSRLVHYRDYDMNTLRRFLGVRKRPDHQAAHRAKEDVYADIDELRRFYDVLPPGFLDSFHAGLEASYEQS